MKHNLDDDNLEALKLAKRETKKDILERLRLAECEAETALRKSPEWQAHKAACSAYRYAKFNLHTSREYKAREAAEKAWEEIRYIPIYLKTDDVSKMCKASKEAFMAACDVVVASEEWQIYISAKERRRETSQALDASEVYNAWNEAWAAVADYDKKSH